MFINMGQMMELYDVEFVVYVGNEIIQQNKMQAPRIMIEQNFKSLCNEILNRNEKMIVVLQKDNYIYENNGEFIRTIKESISFCNKND